MLHIWNTSVRNLLLKGNFGLEKESLRIKSDGSMAHTPDPFTGNRNIVRDFCENQTEINTDIENSPEAVVSALYEFTKEIQRRIAKDDELLWPFSNPAFIKDENDIPIAVFDEEHRSSTLYRNSLSDRYGRYKMTLSGIHVNFSFADELLEEDFKLSSFKDFRSYKDALYLDLAAKLSIYGWIITVLTAASPVLDSSYFEKGVKGKTTFCGMASVRCSELGYWNYFTPIFDFSSIENYADSIQKYVDQGLLKAPSELYFPIRLKPVGENTLENFKNGISHIELRMVDLNPLFKEGINIDDLRFIQLLLIYLVSKPKLDLSVREQVQAEQNFKSAAHYDLKTVKLITPEGNVSSIVVAALELIREMKEYFSIFSGEVMRVLEFEEEKLIDPEKRYAWIIRREYGDAFLSKGLETSRSYQLEALKNC